MRRLVAAAVVIVALSACSGDKPKPDVASPRTSTPAASVAPSVASSAESSSAVEPSVAETTLSDDALTVTKAQATCEFLAAIYPKLQAVGSPVGALAQLTGAYAAFVEKLPGKKVPDAAELDAITTKECPAVRTDVLKVLNAKQFAGTL